MKPSSVLPGIITLALAAVIPGLMLLPVVWWFLKDDSVSLDRVTLVYSIGVGILWLPTLFLIDFLFWKRIRERSQSSRDDVDAKPRS